MRCSLVCRQCLACDRVAAIRKAVLRAGDPIVSLRANGERGERQLGVPLPRLVD